MNLFLFILGCFGILFFLVIVNSPRSQGTGRNRIGRWTGPKVYHVGGSINYKHGQPLTIQTLDEFFNTGKSRTVYWDRIKNETVDSKEELTVLTDHQKTWVDSYE